MTLINNFELDDIEGPDGGGRVDFCAVTGDITRQEARCAFLAVPNEVAVVCAWHSEQGADEWDIDVSDDCDYCVLKPEETYPKEQTAWNYSPMASFVTDDEFSGSLFYVDGHTTQPVLYNRDGELVEDLSSHTPAKDATADEDPWVGFMPGQQANGVRQFSVAGSDFVAYAIAFPDNTHLGGELAIIKLDDEGLIANATPMWIAPANHLGINKGEGRFYHSINVSPEMTDENGKKYVEIMLYKDVNGVAIYQLGEEGFVTGIADAVAEITANGPVKFYNLNGVEVNENNLTAGVYVTLQGGVAKKVLVK